MCEYCRRFTCPPGCPNFVEPEPKEECALCGEGIYVGEEYIVTSDGDFVHTDCAFIIDELLEFLGYEVRTMEETDDGGEDV